MVESERAEEEDRLVAQSAPCSVDAGGLQASLERPIGQRVGRRPNVRLRKCRWTVAYVRTLGSWVQAQARVARRRIGVALTRCRKRFLFVSAQVFLSINHNPPSTTMAAPRSIARKALASASAARSFSTVLAARPALVSAARAAAQGPKLTVRSPPLPFSSPRPLRLLLFIGPRPSGSAAGEEQTRAAEDMKFKKTDFSGSISSRFQLVSALPLPLPIAPLCMHKIDSTLPSDHLQRGVKTIDFAGTKETVYERSDWPLPKLQECVSPFFLLR